MAASVVSLANRALLQIGTRTTIASLAEGSPEANAVNVFFNSTFEMLGRTAWWNCLRKQATLTLLKAAQGTPENPAGTTLPLPPSPWLYSYQLPFDSLHMRYIVPSLPAATGVSPDTTINNAAPTWIPNSGAVPFAVGYDVDANNNPITVVLTNQDQAQAVYTVNQPNPVIWDSLFQQAFVSSIAAYLVPALALNLPLMQASIAGAERMIAEARAADGNEGTQSQNRQADWITARQGGGGVWAYPYSVFSVYPYASAVWPA